MRILNKAFIKVRTKLGHLVKSVNDIANSSRLVTVTSKANVFKVREIVESNGRYIIRDMLLAYPYYGCISF